MLESTQTEPSGLAATKMPPPGNWIHPNGWIALRGMRSDSMIEGGRIAVCVIGGAGTEAGQTNLSSAAGKDGAGATALPPPPQACNEATPTIRNAANRACTPVTGYLAPSGPYCFAI